MDKSDMVKDCLPEDEEFPGEGEEIMLYVSSPLELSPHLDAQGRSTWRTVGVPLPREQPQLPGLLLADEPTQI